MNFFQGLNPWREKWKEPSKQDYKCSSSAHCKIQSDYIRQKEEQIKKRRGKGKNLKKRKKERKKKKRYRFNGNTKGKHKFSDWD